VGECHRGSAAADSAWREILEHFSGATQIGLTATPKETRYVFNIHYFGEPVYLYSLKQGIQDGFLAPYKVVKVHIDPDVEGCRPEKGTVDREGEEVEDRVYNQRDFDRTLVLDERTKLVARKVSDFLKESGDRFQKAIVFCVDEEHAARMRQALVNENQDLCTANYRYVMRITASDAERCAQLGNFIDPEAKYPVVVTTSRLLSTGVDAQTCRLIVIDRAVGSMTEFKQIVGRGTRIHEDTKKYYFTLMDFRGAANHFPAGRPPPRRSRGVPRCLQLHEVRPAHAAGRQQDQPGGFQQPRRAAAFRRYLRADPRRAPERRQRG
jgi:type I restriction enzyme R subunit